MSNSSNKFLMTAAPSECDVCGAKIADKFYDARTKLGSWAYMCHECFSNGVGLNTLGTGFGQRYEKQPDGKWLKTG